MKHLDDEIDLALDNPAPARPGPAYYAALAAAAVILLGTFVAAFTGRLALDSKTLPGVVFAVAALAAVAAAFRNPANR